MTKEQLRKYGQLKKERDDRAERLARLEAEEPAPRTSRLDGMPRGGSGENYVLEAKMDREDELRQLYEEKKAQLNTQLLQIEKAIESLEPTERTILRLYYIDGLTWEEVAVEVGYSWSQTHRYHASALQKLRGVEE